MSEKFSIITLGPSRWQEAKSIRLEGLQTDPLAFGSSYEEAVEMDDRIWQERAQSAFDKKNNLTLYAEVDNRLIGLMGAIWSNRIKTGHIATIYGVYVSTNYRGQGIGTHLLKRVIEEIRFVPQIEKINLTVNTTQHAAQALYKKFEFEPIGVAHRELKYDGQFYDELYMEKLL